jgi:hypothetical protein
VEPLGRLAQVVDRLPQQVDSLLGAGFRATPFGTIPAFAFQTTQLAIQLAGFELEPFGLLVASFVAKVDHPFSQLGQTVAHRLFRRTGPVAARRAALAIQLLKTFGQAVQLALNLFGGVRPIGLSELVDLALHGFHLLDEFVPCPLELLAIRLPTFRSFTLSSLALHSFASSSLAFDLFAFRAFARLA